MLASLLLFLTTTASGFAHAPDVTPSRISAAVSRVYPALVQIHVVTALYNNGREVKGEASGSGAIISAQGHIVTNHHVVAKACRIRVVLADKTELSAHLVGTDPLADIAVIQLDRDKVSTPLPVAEFGNSDSLHLGDTVLAMGCPLAISQSVTIGIVSNLDFVMPGMFWPITFKLDGEEVGSVVKWIGHDAAIYPGNSGGPLVDLDGHIIGINEISLGLAGAIPGNLAHAIADQLIAHGKVERSWIGVVCQPLLRSSKVRRGALVAEVVPHSPAARAGLQAGDVLTKLGGTPVDVRWPEELQSFNSQLFGLPVGKALRVDFERRGQAMNVTVTPVERESAIGEEHELAAWGVTGRNLTRPMAAELKRAGTQGVYVSSVRPSGPCGEAKPSLRAEDIITVVNGHSVNTVDELDKTAVSLGKNSKVLVGFDRGDEHLLTVVTLGETALDEPQEVRKAWLPIQFQVLTSTLAQALGCKANAGVVVSQVVPDSTAAQAGLQVGDIITQVDGQRIASSQPEEADVLPTMIRQYKIGTPVALTVLRAPYQAARSISVKLMDRPRADQDLPHYHDDNFDFEVRDLSPLDRMRERWPLDQKGVLVAEVSPGGWAALAHLAVGDLILSSDGTPVNSVADLKTHMQDVAATHPRHVSLFVRRGIHTLFVELETSWQQAASARSHS
jgi:serine protease Do